jgi:hypothetical protein
MAALPPATQQPLGNFNEAIAFVDAILFIKSVLSNLVVGFDTIWYDMVVQLGWNDMNGRFQIVRHKIMGILVPVLQINLEGLMYDGRVEVVCNHDGQCKEKHLPHLRCHGTKDLAGLLLSCGEQLASDRPLQHQTEPGWFHYKYELFDESFQYAPSQLVGSQMFRCVCIYDCRCFNHAGGKRTWSYTKSSCRKYALVGLRLVPECYCRHIWNY